MKSAVEMYCGEETIKGAPPPFLPKGSIIPEEWEERGQLEEHVCSSHETPVESPTRPPRRAKGNHSSCHTCQQVE